MALQNEAKPDRTITVFAGADIEATATAREHFAPYPPSSPQIGLFKDGQLVFMLERHQIENRFAEQIAQELTQAFDRHCAPAGAATAREVMRRRWEVIEDSPQFYLISFTSSFPRMSLTLDTPVLHLASTASRVWARRCRAAGAGAGARRRQSGRGRGRGRRPPQLPADALRGSLEHGAHRDLTDGVEAP